MRSEAVTSSGGFAVPVRLGIDASEFAAAVQRAMRALPPYTASRGNFDFRPPHVRWAVERERELRAVRRMWDWPRPPA